MKPDVEVAVVGAGIAGAATAYSLARSGRSVMLFEQFELGHARGSSHGTSRIFRLSYPDADFVRLAREALAGWRSLEGDSGEELIERTGSLDLGATAVANADALAACGVEHERLTGAEVATRWPISAAPGEPALFQPDGGATRADRAHAAFVNGAQAAGCDVRERVAAKALGVQREVVELSTDAGDLLAQAVVVTAGAWVRSLLDPLEIDVPVTVTRETATYFALPHADELPTLIDDDNTWGTHAYAVAAPGVGLKAGLHHSGAVADPDEVGEADETVVHGASAWVSRRYPEADPQPLFAETCLYTSTADDSFVLERHGRIVVGSACSGHGFKFAPAVGARLAALALECTTGHR